MKLIILLMTLSLSFAATWKKITGAAGGSAASCPAGFILVPGNVNFFSRDFCVMKYEAQNDGYGTAVSTATGTPWVSITEVNARLQCQALGGKYDLISNLQWQTIGQDIAGVASNWSGGVAFSGQLAFGHADNSPASILIPGSDTAPCTGVTTAGVSATTCSPTVWHAQRRTNTLSNGQVIWDFAGNAQEWTTDLWTAPTTALATAYVSTFPAADIRQSFFGITTYCAAPSATPYCGMGQAVLATVAGGMARGGLYNSTTASGIFAVTLANSQSVALATTGFRCVFLP